MVTLYAALEDRLLVVRGERRSHCAGGTQWELAERLSGTDLNCVAATPDRPERVFVGTVDGRIQRSIDGTRTFETVGTCSDRVTALTVSPHDPDVIWAGTEPSEVYRSADGGLTWSQCGGLTDLPSADEWSFPPRPETHHVRWIAVNPHDPAHIYVAIEAGAFIRSVDGGETWQPHPEGGRTDTHTIATHPDDPCRVYVAAGDGYAESLDCGETWAYPDDGLDHGYVWGLAVDPDDPDRVIVSTASGARRAHSVADAESYIYRKTADDDWELAMDGLPDPDGLARAVLVPGTSAGEFVSLTNHGLFRSHDGAATWQELDVPWDDEYVMQAGQDLSVVP